MKRIRVLLADDHTLIRAGIRVLLERANEIEVVAEAGDGYEALELTRRHKPDLVLLDIAMPGLSGLEVLEAIRGEFPFLRVIILSVHDTEEYARKAMRAGAAGYLPKRAASSELEVAIRMVAQGDEYISPAISGRVRIHRNQTRPKERNLNVELTPRQQDVLRMVANGLSTKQIAEELGISGKTVESHRTLLMDRLNIHDIAGLVRYAIKTGLVEVDR